MTLDSRELRHEREYFTAGASSHRVTERHAAGHDEQAFYAGADTANVAEPMKYCSACASPVVQRIPEGDDRPRYICQHCHIIHYQNPRVVVGCLASAGERVLLCRRAIEPQRGLWTLPAGFLENGESLLQGAVRETREEARADVREETLYRLFDMPRINQVYVFYRALLDNYDHKAGPESLETRLFREEDIPWSQLAFPTVTDLLTDYFRDRRRGEYPVRYSKLSPLWHRHTNQDIDWHQAAGRP